MAKFTKIFYNNEWHDSLDGKVFPTFNPYNENKIIDISEAEQGDIDLAVQAAAKAFHYKSEWRNLDASKRGLLLNKFADLMEKFRDKLIQLESLDNGKPITSSTQDLDFSLGVIRYFSGWSDKISGQTIPADGKFFSFTRKEPVGVVGAIIPWNYPIVFFCLKMAPAIAAGCTIVIKPAEQTPLTALYLASLVKEAGFPAGVINVVPGYGEKAGSSLAHHPLVNKITFTGSNEIGKLIQKASGDSNLKRIGLELGGKSANIVFPDYNVDKAVELAQFAAFINSGQCCSAGTRTFVHASIYDKFVQKSVERAKTLAKPDCWGDPMKSCTQYGPQIDQVQFDKILHYIESGKREGAKLMAGGERLYEKGYFISPAVFVDVNSDMKIYREEIFGPVQIILKFNEIDEVIEMANELPYGLAAGIISTDIEKIMRVSAALKAGSVWVNTYQAVTPQTPFGGYKESGFGRELGEECLHEYTQTKTITIANPFKIS